MTARQAAQQGLGRLINNFRVERVYNLCLEGGGNIIINTTAKPQEAPTLTETATMGYRLEQTKDSQLTGSPTYSQASLQRLGQYKGMSTEMRHFHACEVSVQSNGEIILRPPIPGDNRFDTPARAFSRNKINPQRLTSETKTDVQLESPSISERAQEGEKDVLKLRPREPLYTALSEIDILPLPEHGPPWDPDGTKEDSPEPILTPDSYLLTSNAGEASWTQLRTVAQGATVVQSLPSGHIEDLGGALVTTIESICPYQRPTSEVVLVRLGVACIAAHLHIKLEDEWMTALQATQRGHGTLLPEHTYSQLLGLCLHGGGNVLINTSISADETPTLTGMVTRGYRPDLSSEPKFDRFITYPLHEGREGELRAALAKPSYCDVARHHFKDVLDRPFPASITPSPRSNIT